MEIFKVIVYKDHEGFFWIKCKKDDYERYSSIELAVKDIFKRRKEKHEKKKEKEKTPNLSYEFLLLDTYVLIFSTKERLITNVTDVYSLGYVVTKEEKEEFRKVLKIHLDFLVKEIASHRGGEDLN